MDAIVRIKSALIAGNTVHETLINYRKDGTRILRQIHDRGGRIALDDFGIVYASLTHLKKFPVDHIKIDQSFIKGLETNAVDDAIVAAVVGLGRNLRLHVTAEGAETGGQQKRLLELGCHDVQGYHYALPMQASSVEAFLGTWTWRQP